MINSYMTRQKINDKTMVVAPTINPVIFMAINPAMTIAIIDNQ